MYKFWNGTSFLVKGVARGGKHEYVVDAFLGLWNARVFQRKHHIHQNRALYFNAGESMRISVPGAEPHPIINKEKRKLDHVSKTCRHNTVPSQVFIFSSFIITIRNPKINIIVIILGTVQL